LFTDYTLYIVSYNRVYAIERKNVSPLAQQIYDLVVGNGGRMTYTAVQAALPFQDQVNVPSAFKEAKRAGKLRQEVRQLESGGIVHEYIKAD
jgi:hypothetical protein